MNTINGQTSIFLLDLKGKEFPAIAEVNRKKRVNGQREISLSFLYDEINSDFIHDIEFGWKILFKGEWYTITSPTYSLDGDKFSVGVDAVLSFFVDMNGHYLQDEVEDKSQTAAAYFTELFKDTGYNYVLVDNLAANTLNYQANQSKTERFLYGIDRFNAEYVIRGKLAYLHGLIGSDKNVILHEDLNIQDVSIEVDGSGFHTWAKGYYDKDEGEGTEDADYKHDTEYHIPELVDKHGWIEGPAIYDGRMKSESVIHSAIKKQIENSYKISTTINAVDLTNNGYPEMQFEEGDRVWLYVTELKQNQQVRVVEIDETFDWEGNIIDAKYTVGNEGIAARYKTQQYSTLKDFRDISSGRKTLEFNWLPEAIKRASDIINGNLDSHFSYGAGEIIGINRSNPNGYMRFNTDGLGFSRDGGATYSSAITYEGIVADAITTGTLRAILIEGVEIYGSRFSSVSGTNWMEIVGGNIHLEQNNGRYMDIGPSGMYGYNAGGSVRFQADSSMVTSGVLGTSTANVYLAAQSGQEARMVTYTDLPGTGHPAEYNYIPVRASGFKGNYLDVNHQGSNAIHLYLRTPSDGEIRATSVGTTDVWRPIRAHKLYAEHIETNNFEILSLRTNDRVRVQGKGTSGAYKDIQAKDMLVKALTTHPDVTTVQNLYLGSENEVRSVNSGYIYGDSGIFYRGFRGSSFNESSSRELKENIKPLTETALNVIENLEVVEYNLINEKESVGLFRSMPKKERHVGFIAETSNPISSDDGKAVNIGKTTAYLTKAVQELDVNLTTEVARIDDKLNKLELENQYLKQKIKQLECAI